MQKLFIYAKAARKAFLGSPKPGRVTLVTAAVLFVLTALIALWNVDNRDGIHCGSWLSPNDALAAQADAEQNTKDSRRALRDALLESGGDLNAPVRDRGCFSDDSQVSDCHEARKGRIPTVVVFGVATLALLVVGVLRRYQPQGGPIATGSAEPRSG